MVIVLPVVLPTETSAFFLRSQPPNSFHSVPSAATIKTTVSIGFLKSSYFQDVQCDIEKKCCSTLCFLRSASGHDGSGNGVGDSEEADSDNKSLFVHYTVSIDGQQSRKTKIKVNEGDNIDSIIEGIKAKNDILLASVDVLQIELFTSAETEKPLDAFEEWNPNVSWGTKTQPLIVKVNSMFTSVEAKSPWKNNNSECF